MKNSKRLIVTITVGAIVAASVYWTLHNGGADDAGFFTGLLTASMVLALATSPNRDLRLGLKNLWFLDWLPVVLMPFMILAMAPSEPIAMAAARYICFFLFFLAGVTTVRRYLSGRREK